MENSTTYQVFLLMDNLHTFTLVDCDNIPFILALDPNHNTSNIVTCPKLEGLVLYICGLYEFCIDELFEMVKQRALRGVKLSTIVIISEGLDLEKAVLSLRQYVSHVEYKLDEWFPRWDLVPSEICELDDDNDWQAYSGVLLIISHLPLSFVHCFCCGSICYYPLICIPQFAPPACVIKYSVPLQLFKCVWV